MATVKIFSACPYGIDARLVTVEVDVRRRGMPAFALVGLPDASIRESKERVMAAIRNAGIKFPSARITVNLAPADFKKEGPEFDLPIACGILAGAGEIPEQAAKTIFRDYLFLGELGLDGSLRQCRGALAAALLAKELGHKGIVLSKESRDEAAASEGIEIMGCPTLQNLLHWLCGRIEIEPYKPAGFPWESLSERTEEAGSVDWAEIQGQTLAKKALETAAAGGHHALMIGPPGTGKTLLARAFSGIIPALSKAEAVEVSRIHSAAAVGYGGLIRSRPFRSPHHTSSPIALVGGGAQALPGEVSLAHFGVLFLDEMAEFQKNALEALRQPLEDGFVSVSRAAARFRYPARFSLIGATNPCPCGYFGSRDRDCVCGPNQIVKYRRKFSGPILDRMDIHVEVSGQEARRAVLNGTALAEGVQTREQVLGRVIAARLIQKDRFRGRSHCLNAHMGLKDIRAHCRLSDKEKLFLGRVMEQFSLSARAYHRILKVARTLADLGSRGEIAQEDIAMAVKMRCLDKPIVY